MARATVNNSFEEVLKILVDALDRIFSHEVPDSNSYMKTYTLVYDYCTSASIAKAESRLYTTATGRQKYLLQMCDIRSDYRPVAGGQLYYNIENYLIKHVRKLCQLGENLEKEDLLRFYVNQWRQYQFSSDLLNRTFHYLDRHWIRRANDSNFKATHDILPLSMLIWREILWKSLKDKLTATCSNLIYSYRHNQVVEIHFLDEIIKSYKAIDFPKVMCLYLDDQYISLPNENIYENYFEKPFLQDTITFYQSQTVFDFDHDAILEYLEKITPFIDNDMQDIYPYLSHSTQLQMMELIEKIFFKDHLNIIYYQTDILIAMEDMQDLKIIYQSIKHVSNIKNGVVNRIEDHFNQVATTTIEGMKETAINDPKVYVETMLNIHEKCFRFVQETFNGEQCFIIAIGKVCRKFINNNAVTQTVGSTTKSSELLARYCDALPRKGTKAVEETDLKEKFNEMMLVFNYIDDKDVFLKFYQKLLTKRLVGQFSASDDYEELMISKLKQACGFEYTSKLERMFQDIGVSKSLIVEYEQYCESHQVIGIVDFSVMILTSSTWPFSALPNVVLPIELKSTFDSFTDFYTHRHNGRKLTWLHQHSKGELQTFFTSQKYILQVSIYQMVVLLLFNKVFTWTVERIQDETQIKSELLLQILFGLLRSKLLVCSDIHEDELDEDFKETDIKTNYSIRLSTDFRSKRLRIKLNVPLKSVEQKEVEDVHHTIDEDRQMVIQAAIVRIMKARQTLKHALLMQEVIQQLSSRFKPNIPIIKKCIDILIKKQYLERDSKEKDLLRYLT